MSFINSFVIIVYVIIAANGWGCDQFGRAGLGIYPTLKSPLRAVPTA